MEGVCAAFGHKVGELHFLEYSLYITLDIACQELVNMCQLNILVLNIFCQQLEDIRQFDDVFAPFGHSVGESEFSRVYICIVYTLPTIVKYVSAEYIYIFIMDILGRYMTVAWCWGMCVFWNMHVSFILQISPIYSPDIPKLFPKYHPDITMITL